MKTKQNIIDEIDHLEATGLATGDQKEKNRICKRLSMIRPLLKYFEQVDVKESSIDRQLREVIRKMELIDHEFNETYPTYVPSKVKSDFMNAKGMPQLKKQLKSLQYLMEKH
jgi:hypothetical protein